MLNSSVRAQSWQDGQCRVRHQVKVRAVWGAGSALELAAGLQSYLGVQTKPVSVSSTALWCAGLSMLELLRRSFPAHSLGAERFGLLVAANHKR